MKICSIYARVSDESQVKGDSIAHQIDFAREFALRRGRDVNEEWVTPDEFIFVDEGITGTSFVKRPAVQLLIERAKAGAFEIVLFKGISRFARDTVDALVMLRTLLSSNVRVISMEENYDSDRDKAEFVFTIHSALAQAESEKTAIRVRMGAMQKAKAGMWNGRPPDGYLLNPVTKHLVIDDVFAPTIRLIYELYVRGFGCRSIAKHLNDAGIRTKQGNLWNQRNIARILQNPVYRGDVVYGRTEQKYVLRDGDNPSARRKAAVPAVDTGQVVCVQDAHPGIVSTAIFKEVQQQMQRRRWRRGRTSEDLILGQGLLRCRCQSAMGLKRNGRGTPYYRCLRQTDQGRKACNAGYIRADELDSIVLAHIRMHVLPSLPIDEAMRGSAGGTRAKTQLTSYDMMRQALNKRLEALLDQLMKGHISEEQFSAMNRTIQKQLDELRQAEAIETLAIQTLAADAPDLQRQWPYMRQQLFDALQPNQRSSLTRDIVREFVERIDVVEQTAQEVKIEITYRVEQAAQNHGVTMRPDSG